MYKFTHTSLLKNDGIKTKKVTNKKKKKSCLVKPKKKKKKQLPHPQPKKSKKEKEKKAMSREKKERKRQQLPRKAQKKKRKKKKEKNWMNCPFALAHMYFCPLSIPLFSLQFSLHFGEGTFWWVWGENTRAPPFIFLPPT